MIAKLNVETEQPLIQGAYVLLGELTANAESVSDSPFGHLLTAVQKSSRNKKIGELPLAPVQKIASGALSLVQRSFLLVTFLGFLLWRLWPRRGIQISFEEITAEESKKVALDRILMQDVQQAFWVPRTELSNRGISGLELAAIKDYDASGFGNLVPQRPLIPLVGGGSIWCPGQGRPCRVRFEATALIRAFTAPD